MSSLNSLNSLNQKQIICPHCWHPFYKDQAFYISTHPELFGDDVLGEKENKRLPPSEIRDRSGIAIDPKGGRVSERACPECHLQIPPDFMDGTARFFSIVGAPASGKTYFLTSMLHELRRELSKNFGLTLRDCDSHEIRVFLDYESTLFGGQNLDAPTQLEKTQEAGKNYNSVRLHNIDVQLPKPLMFSLSPTIANPDKRVKKSTQTPVVLYDNAGESFDFGKERSSNSRVTQHLSKSDAILFSYDPLLDVGTRQRLKTESNDPQRV